jgi:hypothetical protein
MTFEYDVTKNKELGLYEATLSVTLPTITVTRYKADRDDFKYEISRAVTEIVEEIVQKAIENED